MLSDGRHMYLLMFAQFLSYLGLIRMQQDFLLFTCQDNLIPCRKQIANFATS